MNPIGVVICNYNKKDFVLQCVQSVLESKEKNFDIYVVDNASSDGSAEALKKAYGNRITVIENKENLGGSGGFNTGLRIVRDKGYSYFMCLDDDAAVDENALSVLYHYMEEHTDTGMAGCRVYHTQMPDYIQQSGLLIDFENCTAKTIGADMPEDGSLPDVIECDTVATCAVMVRADAVKQNGVGIMPEDNFIYWDDMEWGYRIELAGYRVVTLAEAKALHQMGANTKKENTFINYYMWRNRTNFFMRFTPEAQMKATFNLIPGWFAKEGTTYPEGETYRLVTKKKAKEMYEHPLVEVANHGNEHKYMTSLTPLEMAEDTILCRKSLESLYGKIIRGMAYPYGWYDDTLIDVLKQCGITYCRTVESTENFDLPENWLAWNPTCHHDDEALFDLADEFVSKQNVERPLLFYVWGHTFEFERNNNWERMDRFMEKVAKQDDVWYATNGEIYDYVNAYENLVFSADGKRIYNPSKMSVWVEIDGTCYKIEDEFVME